MSAEIQRETGIRACNRWLRERAKHRNGLTPQFIKDLFDSSIRDRVLTISSIECYYQKVQESIDYIKNAEKETILVVAIFYDDGQNILSACKSLPQLKLVYTQPLVAANEIQVHEKQAFIDTDHDKFVDQVCLDSAVLLDDQPKFHCLDSNNNSTMNLLSQNAPFLWSKILSDSLKDLSNDNDAVSDVLHTMKQSYQHSPATQKQIDDFLSTYHSENIIHLYTSKSFFYQSLNAALRTEDVSALYSFQLPINDLCEQLDQLHQHYIQTHPSVTVYHGQYMNQSELDQLRNNIGNLISLNTFWSSSFDEEVAKTFAGYGQPRPGQCSIVFQIDIDSALQSTFFAPIEHLSPFKDEREVLIGLRSVFEIRSIELDSKSNWWSIHLVATDKGNEIYEEYKTILRKEAEADNIHIIFGCLMITMGKHKKAVDYFHKLTDRLPKDDFMLQGSFRRHYSRALYMSGKYEQARVLLTEALDMFDNNNVSSENINYMALQLNLANVYMFLRKYDDALQLYQTVLHTQEKVLPPDHRDFGETYSGLAWAYGQLSQPDKALELTFKALEHFKKVLPPNHPAIPRTLKGLAGNYKSRGQLDLALKYHHEALEQFERYLPKDHPMIATALREIGDIYGAKNDHKTALDYDLRSCNMQKRNYPDGHLLIANSLQVIRNIYRDLKQFDEALKYHFESIEMRKTLEPPDNFVSKNDLGETYLELGNTKEAIHCFEFTCQTKTARFGAEDASTLLTKGNLGIAYSENGDTAHAQEIFEEVLATQKRLYPNGDHRIGITLRRMGSNYAKMNKIDEARKCFEDGLQILEQHLAADHYQVKLVKEKLLKLIEQQQAQ